MDRSSLLALAIVSLFTFLPISESLAQMMEEDKEKFETSLRWLENNLSYVYQNKSTDEWWNNSFFYNRVTQEINIKNASSDVPHGTDKNVYFDRKVNLNDLDVTSLRIEEVKKNKGRIVKGKVLHIDAIGKNQRIQKLYNGKPSFKEFFLQISFPSSNDSLFAKAEDCKMHFENILLLGTKIYPAPDSLTNTNTLFARMPGKYKGSDLSTCEVEELFPHSLEMKFYRGDKLYKKSVISYDESNHHFIYWMVNVAGSSHFELNLHFENELNLESNAQNYQLTFPNSHSFSIIDQGQNVTYNRIDFQ